MLSNRIHLINPIVYMLYRFYLFIVILIILVFGNTSCKHETIPERDMVKIFSEIFITDAVVSTSHYSYKFSKRDTIEYYKPIYSKLGYSDKQFALTIDHYLDNPDILDKLLDKVVNNLAHIEAEHKATLLQDKEVLDDLIPARDPNNLWEAKDSLALPRDGDKDSLYFRIQVMDDGLYRLTAKVKVMPNDESIEPYASMWFTVDSTGVRHDVQRQAFIKDGNERALSLTLTLKDSTYTHIEGVILGHIEQEGDWKKFAEVSNIRLAYKPILEPKINRQRILMEHDTSMLKSGIIERQLPKQ